MIELNLRKKYNYFMTTSPNKGDHNYNSCDRPNKIVDEYRNLKKSAGNADIFFAIEIDGEKVSFSEFRDTMTYMEIK